MKNNIIKKSIAYFVNILFLFFPVLLFATTPSITNVTGGISNGEIVDINGSYMVDEDKTNWGTSYQSGTKYGFEGIDYLSDGYFIAPDANSQERIYDSDVKIMGNQSYRGRIYGDSSNCPVGNHSAGLAVGNENISENDIYVRMYSRWRSVGLGSQWPDSHIKMIDGMGRIYPDDIASAQMYFQPVAGTDLPTQMAMYYPGAPSWPDYPFYDVDNFLQEDRWYTMEVRFKSSAPRNFTAWVDGVQLDSVTPTDGGPFQYIMFNIINACLFEDLDLTNWTDGFAISSSRIYLASKIEISNNAVYGNGIIKYQEPIYLSDNDVQFRVDLEGLGSGPYYLWVTNNRQEVSNCYLLSSDSIPPSAPTGLNVL